MLLFCLLLTPESRSCSTRAARFFDSTPSGRILNRLSRDVQVIDQDLPTSGMFWTYEILAALAIVVVIVVLFAIAVGSVVNLLA